MILFSVLFGQNSGKYDGTIDSYDYWILNSDSIFFSTNINHRTTCFEFSILTSNDPNIAIFLFVWHTNDCFWLCKGPLHTMFHFHWVMMYYSVGSWNCCFLYGFQKSIFDKWNEFFFLRTHHIRFGEFIGLPVKSSI